MPRKLLLAALVLSSISSFVRAEDRFESFFSPRNAASVTAAVEPGRHDTPDITQVSARGAYVMSKTKQNTWTVSGLAARAELERAVFLPPAGPVFPEELSEISGGVAFLNKTDDRRLQGANISIGSASDDMFQSIRETEINVTGSAMRPSGAANAWIFLFNYSNNRTFLNNIPLPGLAYMWLKPQKGFRAIVGFPFIMLSYQRGLWTSSASLVGSTNYSISLTRRLHGPLEAYAGFERSPQQWLRAGREDKKNRLIYDENKVMAGLRSPLSNVLSFDAAVGRTYNRRLFEAEDATDKASKVRLDDAWVYAIKLSAKWK